MDIKNSNSNAASNIWTDAAVDDDVLFGEQFDDSLSGQGKGFVLSLQKLPCASCGTLL